MKWGNLPFPSRKEEMLGFIWICHISGSIVWGDEECGKHVGEIEEVQSLMFWFFVSSNLINCIYPISLDKGRSSTAR